MAILKHSLVSFLLKSCTQFSSAYSLADPLGIGAIFLSKDQHIIALQRSKYVSEACGMIDFPGGHPEPSAAGANHIQDICKLDPIKVRNELFDGMQAEIEDEINIPKQFLSSPLLIGFYTNNDSTFGRTALVFLVTTELTTDEIHAYYKKGPKEKYESTQLISWPFQQIHQVISTIHTEENQDVVSTNISSSSSSLSSSSASSSSSYSFYSTFTNRIWKEQLAPTTKNILYAFVGSVLERKVLS